MRTRRSLWTRYALLSIGLLAMGAAGTSGLGADDAPAPMDKVTKPNYELASQWPSAKAAKLIFDTAVTPHWLDSGDRFWYTFENSKGRKFYLVEPAKKTKSYVFDPVKLAASLTAA